MQITKSNFMNNTVSYGIIKVLSSSTLKMSDCTLQKNSAIDYAGAILIDRSFVYLTNTNLYDNKAVHCGRALHVKERSILYLKNCTFSNNHMYSWTSAENIEHTFGGAIVLLSSVLNGANVTQQFIT